MGVEIEAAYGAAMSHFVFLDCFPHILSALIADVVPLIGHGVLSMHLWLWESVA